MLVLIRSNLPKKLRETAYAVALEVAAADLNVRPEETRFLEMLRDSLELDPLTATAIERGIRARNLTVQPQSRMAARPGPCSVFSHSKRAKANCHSAR